MSFILDAIAKSERERQQQEIPDARILAIPAGDTRRPRRIWPYLLAGALLLNVIVLSIWVQTDDSPLDRLWQTENNGFEPSAANRIDRSDNVGSVNETANIEFTDSAGSDTQIVGIDQAKPPAVGAKPSVPKPVAKTSSSIVADNSVAGTKDKVLPRVEATGAGSQEKTDAMPSQEVAEKTGDNNATSITIEPRSHSDDIGDTDPANKTGMLNVAEPEQRKVFRLSDLPADVRRDLPSVAFSGHLFSKNVNVSYVMVDGGRSVIAGQQIVGDVFLHEVTPTGAIVDFRGFLIEIGILQNWSLN